VSVASQGRQLSACTNKVLVPFQQSTIPDADDHANTDQKVRFQLQRGFPGLSGESRLSDGNNQSFHGSGVPNPAQVQPVPPTVVDQPPPRRPDIPCETQQLPDLHAAKGTVATSGGVGAVGGVLGPFTDLLPRKFKAAPLMEAGKMLKANEQKQLDKERATAKKAEAKKAAGGDQR
jgi:hypothetical protein